jgi:hypothetical protein
MFVFICWIFARGLFRARSAADALYFLPFVAFFLLWYRLASRMEMENLCSVELAAGNGIFRWSWRIFRWGRDIEAGTHDVTAIEAKVRWYGNRLSVSMNGKTYSLGGLLDEDLAVIARELRRALPNADKP